MNWEAIGAVGEVLGALGVFASLVYLAMQIRQNTRMMKATVRQQLATASQAVTFEIGRNADVMARALGGDLSEEDSFRLASLTRATLRGYENYAYQREHGLFDASEWSGIRENMRSLMALPEFRAEWIRTRAEYSPRLQPVLDELAEEAERAS